MRSLKVTVTVPGLLRERANVLWKHNPTIQKTGKHQADGYKTDIIAKSFKRICGAASYVTYFLKDIRI